MFTLKFGKNKICLTKKQLEILASNLIKLIIEDGGNEIELNYNINHIKYVLDYKVYICEKTSLAFLNKVVDVLIYLQVNNELLSNVLNKMRLICKDAELTENNIEYLRYMKIKCIYDESIPEQIIDINCIQDIIKDKKIEILKSHLENCYVLYTQNIRLLLINIDIDEIKLK